jgi:hypothetical protein
LPLQKTRQKVKIVEISHQHVKGDLDTGLEKSLTQISFMSAKGSYLIHKKGQVNAPE